MSQTENNKFKLAFWGMPNYTKAPILIIFAVFIFITIFLSCFQESSFLNDDYALNYYIKKKNLLAIDTTLEKLKNSNDMSLDMHFLYVSNHFKLNKLIKTKSKKIFYRNDTSITEYYEKLKHSDNYIQSNYAYFASALIAYYNNKFLDCNAQLDSVKDKNIKYYNFIKGELLLHTSSELESEKFYLAEINNNGYISESYQQLSDLYSRNDSEKLKKIILNNNTSDFVPKDIKSEFYKKNKFYFSYLALQIELYYDRLNIISLIASFMILLTWLFYLRNIDIYEKEKWKHSILTVFLGIIGVLLVIPISNFIKQEFGFSLDGTLLNDFLYCIFGIGLVEETMKIIPFLIILNYTEEINEPFDYIYFASLSALGFAFIENIKYFDFYYYDIIHVRAVISTSLHMIFTSIIAFALMMSKYEWKNYNKYLIFAGSLFVAAIVHGLFDFFLINPSLQPLNLLSLLIFVLLVLLWNKLINDCVSNSSFFDASVVLNLNKISSYLLYSLFGIFMFEYISIAIKDGYDSAIEQMMLSMKSGFYLIIFISSKFSSIKIKRNEWFLVDKPYQEIMHIDINQIVGLKIDIQSFQQPGYALAYFPNQGEIKSKLINSRWNDLFLLELTNPFENDEFNANYTAIRLNENADGLFFGNKQIIKLFLIDKNYDLESSIDTFQFVKYCGTIVAQKIKENPEIIEE